MKLNILNEARVSGKTVFLRADLDVPLSKVNIEDDTRLLAWMPTLEYLLKNGARVIIAGHLGRPTKQFSIFNFQFSKTEEEFSLRPIAEWLGKRFKIYDLRFKNLYGFDGWEIGQNVFLLENLRFYKGEEENDKEFAKKLASMVDVYVNDAFAASHRVHASIVGIPNYLPHFVGFRLLKEIEVLSKVLNNPERPLVIIIGGAKLETKLPLVEKMHHFADYVLVGGKIAQETKSLLKIQHEKLKGIKSVLLVGDLNESGFDITSKSIGNFVQTIGLAKTIVWNGPVGFVENQEDDSTIGSRKLAKAIVNSKIFCIVGGGDTLGFLKSINLLDKFSFVSTGGGAMLEFLSSGKLPGIEALK
jgi:phosphoglycerate kinase